KGAHPRVSSPWCGSSILITSAPMSPSSIVQKGPARTRVKSRTVRPARGSSGKGPTLFEPLRRFKPSPHMDRARGLAWAHRFDPDQGDGPKECDTRPVELQEGQPAQDHAQVDEEEHEDDARGHDRGRYDRASARRCQTEFVTATRGAYPLVRADDAIPRGPAI